MPAANVTLRVRAAGARAAAADVNATASAVGRLNKAASGASRTLATTGRRMKSTGSEMTHGLTVPILAIGGAAAKMALDFQDSMMQIETQAGAPVGEVANLRGQVLGLAHDSQFAPKALADALYHAESLGYRGSRAMNLLRAAVKGATVGHADLEDTISSLGGVVRTGVKGTGNYRQAMATLNATVGAGNMRMDQLIEGLGTGVVAAMKTAGLSLQDYTGALAVFTDENIPASSASAQLATALHYLYAPTDKGEKALNAIGLSGRQLARDFNKPRGLLVAMRDLKHHIGDLHSVDARQTLASILPGGRGRILLTLLNQLEVYRQKMDQIQNTSQRFGASYRQTMLNPLTRLKTAWSSVQVALVRIGAAIVPIIVPLFEKIANFVDKAANAFNRLSPSARKWIVIGLLVVAVLGPLLSMLGVMVITIGALAGAFSFLISPVTLFIAAGVALAVLLVHLWKHSQTFRDIVVDLWKLFLNSPIGLPIKMLGHLISAVWNARHQIGHALSGLWEGFKSGFVSVFNWVIGKINWMIRAYNNTVGRIPGVDNLREITPLSTGPRGHDWQPGAIHNVGTSHDLAHGGAGAQTFRRSGATRPARSGSTSGDLPHGDIHTHVYIDGREVARAVHRQGVKAKSSR